MVLLTIDNLQRFSTKQHCHLRASIDLDINIGEEISIKGICFYNFSSNKKLDILLWVPFVCKLCNPVMHWEVSRVLNEVQTVCSSEHMASQNILGPDIGALVTDYVKMNH